MYNGSDGGISSINGMTGVVVLDKNSVGLDDVDNTSDMDKPISMLVQTELDSLGTALDFLGTELDSLDKNSVGLDDVDNTSDMDKPISMLVQTELDSKADSSAIGIDPIAAAIIFGG